MLTFFSSLLINYQSVNSFAFYLPVRDSINNNNPDSDISCFPEYPSILDFF